jgi:hypothetical protein
MEGIDYPDAKEEKIDINSHMVVLDKKNLATLEVLTISFTGSFIW